jgi:hypothetical protein
LDGIQETRFGHDMSFLDASQEEATTCKASAHAESIRRHTTGRGPLPVINPGNR